MGLWAIAWKKNFIYTVIEYEDEHDTLGLIFDFGKHLESKQELIYWSSSCALPSARYLAIPAPKAADAHLPLISLL